ncbi:hypothetical protein EG328_004110 [Venturia inaequalis]|uniref:Uncharacterized protein n=1 Tax=Venturia inaequalis TaxID=5025 RepID=A0A8H3Z8E7_VENIN|nr:hypothetical protein EG328_004110 [Venturia inaequalis]
MNPPSLRAGLSVIIPSPISSHHFFPHYRINCPPGCSQCARTRRPSCRELDHCPHECNRCTNVYNTADADLYGQFQSARQEIADLKATVESLEAHMKLAEHTHKAHEATIRRLQTERGQSQSLAAQNQSSENKLLRSQLHTLHEAKNAQIEDIERMTLCNRCHRKNRGILSNWGVVLLPLGKRRRQAAPHYSSAAVVKREYRGSLLAVSSQEVKQEDSSSGFADLKRFEEVN